MIITNKKPFFFITEKVPVIADMCAQNRLVHQDQRIRQKSKDCQLGTKFSNRFSTSFRRFIFTGSRKCCPLNQTSLTNEVLSVKPKAEAPSQKMLFRMFKHKDGVTALNARYTEVLIPSYTWQNICVIHLSLLDELERATSNISGQTQSICHHALYLWIRIFSSINVLSRPRTNIELIRRIIFIHP